MCGNGRQFKCQRRDGGKAMLMRTSTRELFKGNILKMLEIYYLKYVRNLYSY